MYRELLKIRGFSEDCIKSILHCLICTLIKLTKSDEFEVCIQVIYIYNNFFNSAFNLFIKTYH